MIDSLTRVLRALTSTFSSLTSDSSLAIRSSTTIEFSANTTAPTSNSLSDYPSTTEQAQSKLNSPSQGACKCADLMQFLKEARNVSSDEFGRCPTVRSVTPLSA